MSSAATRIAWQAVLSQERSGWFWITVWLPELFRTPTSRCRIVLGTRLDPAFAIRGFLALPERGVGFQPVDQEMAGGERRLAMWRCRRDQHDAVTWFEPTIAMDDQRGGKRPALVCLSFDLGQFL